MEKWKKFAELSNQLESLLGQKVTEANRDDLLKKVNQILDEREYLVKELPQASTREERQLIDQVLQKEPQLEQRLDRLFKDLKAAMRTMKKKKSSNQRYTNPYQSVSSYDGKFMDHRK
ncbi:flagellar protein FliT [Halobacillus rhizosphaerae]|uniref:flagellar protein FliT n=1 Tax=Halobacillus rhizosphaerae TaxID=3064889 RepID=UPI00398B856D